MNSVADKTLGLLSGANVACMDFQLVPVGIQQIEVESPSLLFFFLHDARRASDRRQS